MPAKKEPEKVTTKTGVEITTCYCRKCMKDLPHHNFYDGVDLGIVDANGKMSVCSSCIQLLYEEVFEETQIVEKTLHKLCIMLNIRYSNDVASATRTQIETMRDRGKNVRGVFGIYKSKLIATRKSMDKSEVVYDGYEDVGTIFVEQEQLKTIGFHIPDEVRDFWGKELSDEDVEFLEKEYTNFKKTYSTEKYAEVVLLKQVCFTLLAIKKIRQAAGDTTKLVKELQDLMKSLSISPSSEFEGKADQGAESFGRWIADIEEFEPAQWLETDPLGDAYRDVSNVEEYYNKFIVRPLKNFITGSKDFNVDDVDDSIWDDSDDEYPEEEDG